MKVIILGASGMLGQTLTKRCNQAGFNVYECSSKTVDITSETAINTFFNQFKSIDYIINCAAYTKVDDCETETQQANAINGTALTYIAKATKKHNATLIQLSTDYVFDGKKLEPYVENDHCSPVNAYGQSKLLGEEACKKHCDQYYILRVQWLYGANGNHFVDTMKTLLNKHSKLTVVDDQIGSLTSVESLAAYIVCFINKQPEYGVYHVADKGYASWYEVTQEIANLTQYSGNIQPVDSSAYPRPAKRQKNSRLDCSKFDRAIGPIRSTWQDQLRLYINSTKVPA